MPDKGLERDAFAEKLFQSALGYFDLLSIRFGQRLGLYDVFATGSVTSEELASRAGIAERYAREWLEQQTTAEIIAADIKRDPVTFTLPAGHAEVLLDVDSLSYIGASVSQLYSITNAFEQVIDAFRTGGGVPYEAYGADSIEGQGASNRPVSSPRFRTTGSLISPRCTNGCEAAHPHASWTSGAGRGGLQSRSPRPTRT